MKIILYTTGCPKCKILKQKLDEKNIQYVAYDDINIMLSQGIKSAPMLKVGEEMKNFNEAILWIKEI